MNGEGLASERTNNTKAAEESLVSTEYYRGPDQNCDVVMKGGITSGVVYPRAICALAGTYRLRNIGGTSAGAIAAAAAAAAEYCRANGSEDGFTKLFDLPDELAQKGLQRLFIPQSKTISLYKLVLAFIGSSPWYIKLSKALLKLFAYFPIGAVVGALPGLLILISLNATGPIPFWLWVFLSLFLIALPSFLMALLNVVVQAIWAIPANNYGLCGGLAGKPGSQALTEWISDKSSCWLTKIRMRIQGR